MVTGRRAPQRRPVQRLVLLPAPPRTSARSAAPESPRCRVPARVWRSASCLTRRAASSSSSGAPICTGHAVSSRERRSAEPQSPAGHGQGGGRGACCPSARSGGSNRWNSCGTYVADILAHVDHAGADVGHPPFRVGRGPNLVPRITTAPARLRPDPGKMRLTAALWPDQQAARGPASRASGGPRPAPPRWMAPAGSPRAPCRPDAAGRAPAGKAGRTPHRSVRTGRRK